MAQINYLTIIVRGGKADEERDIKMDNVGSFRKKKGFTIIGNRITRDTKLSLKAKGLYALIQSYITFKDLELSKTFLLKNCQEGEKAFETAWQELKKGGYLKQYMQPVGRCWNVEYELLDEPLEGPHTFYLTKDGQVSSTNLGKEGISYDSTDDRCPQNGGNAKDRIPRYGSSAQGSNGKGGDKRISTIDNTKDNINNHLSIIPYTSEEIEILTELCTDDFIDQHEASTFKLFNDSLAEMTMQCGIATYGNIQVTAEMVIRQIDLIREKEWNHSLALYTQQTIKDFVDGITGTEVRNHKGYMKACIWNSFSTYETKVTGEFLRTYEGAI